MISIVRVWWRRMERNSWVYPTNKIRRRRIKNSSCQENGWTRTRSCNRSRSKFEKENFKSRIKGNRTSMIKNVLPTWNPRSARFGVRTFRDFRILFRPGPWTTLVLYWSGLVHGSPKQPNPKLLPIQKPQLTFYHLRDDLCFYWVKITFWFWIFFYLVRVEVLEQY